jgi:hypothetical protein
MLPAGYLASARDVRHHVLHQGRIDYEDVQDSLLELAVRFRVREIAFDPRSGRVPLPFARLLTPV